MGKFLGRIKVAVHGVSVVLLAFAAVFAATAVHADQAEDTAMYAQGEQALARFDADVKELSATFEQKVFTADGRLKETSSGTLKLQRPGRFAWIYEQPYEQRIIADGELLWSYDVDLEQVSVREQGEALGQSPAQILSGSADALSGFDYQGSFQANGLLWAQLAATKDNGDFAAVRIAFDSSGDIAGLEIADELGQITRILFAKVSINSPIDEMHFKFTPPPGVDVIGLPDSTEPQPNPDPKEGSDAVSIVSGLG